MNMSYNKNRVPVSTETETPTCPEVLDVLRVTGQFRLQAEAGDLNQSDVGSQIESSQTVSFLDNEGGVRCELPKSVNAVAKVDNTDDLSLGKFLARPTLIDTTTWSTSDFVGVKTTLQPWYLFLNNTVIKKKIDNYAFMRGNLHLKVVINGTPFQYGTLRACYSPLLGWVSDKIRNLPASGDYLLASYSQQPGFYIYPQANAGGEMECRFFLHKNWMDITSATEVQNMGTVNLVVFAGLGVAVTGGSTAVTVRTYAWMTDVELMASTSKLALQGDEYGNGPISRPATAIAAVAANLTKIPFIGNFARATEIGASAVSAIATMFGYTNVPVIADVHAYTPMNAPALASAHVGTAIQKLTLDPKQELSIDPSPHGIGSQDELALSYIKTKESFFASTTWSTADPTEDLLFTTRINPALYQQVDVTGPAAAVVGKRVWHTPLSYTGAMFRHWRGDIKIRMKIVCTKFHKGRLKISYDPRNDITAVDPGENSVYTQIVDIGETDDIELTVPYHQDLGWLTHDQTIQDNWTTGASLAPRAGIDNGTLTIRVLNALTAPASGTIRILFFVRGGDDFEYANPTGHIGPDGSNVVPSFFALQAEDLTNVVTTAITIGTPAKVVPERYGLNYGECIASLRNVLHRYMVMDTVPIPSATGGLFNVIRKSYKRMPYTPGYDPSWTATSANKVVASSGTAGFAFNTMSHLAYVSGMFLGYRGGVNFVVTPSSDLYGSLDDVRVTRSTDTVTTATNRFITNNYNTGYTPTISTVASMYGRNYYLRDGLGGMAITATRTNGSLMFNLPDFNNYNFSFVDPTTYLTGSTSDGTRSQHALLSVNLKRVASADPNTSISCSVQTEIAGGPDFTCLHFLCCPTLDYQLNEPTPV